MTSHCAAYFIRVCPGTAGGLYHDTLIGVRLHISMRIVRGTGSFWLKSLPSPILGDASTPWRNGAQVGFRCDQKSMVARSVLPRLARCIRHWTIVFLRGPQPQCVDALLIAKGRALARRTGRKRHGLFDRVLHVHVSCGVGQLVDAGQAGTICTSSY